MKYIMLFVLNYLVLVATAQPLSYQLDRTLEIKHFKGMRSALKTPEQVYILAIGGQHDRISGRKIGPDFFSGLKELHNLHELRLEEMSIEQLPDVITQLNRLETLVIYNVKGINWDNAFRVISAIKSLKSLEVVGAKIEGVSTSIKLLRQLTLNRCEVDSVSLGHFSGLSSLKITNSNSLTSCYFLANQNLDELIINSCPNINVRCILDKIYNQPITLLSLKNCGLTFLPNRIGEITTLQRLFIDENKLKTLPYEIRYLHQLKAIVISDDLPDLPNDFESVTGLKREGIGGNFLRK